MMKRFLGIFLALIIALASIAPASAQFVDQRVFGGTAGGTSSAYTLSIGNWPTTPVAGIPVRFNVSVANPGAATLAIGSSGTFSLFKPSPAGPIALSGGELQPNMPIEVVFNVGINGYVITNNLDATASTTIIPPQGYLTPCPAAGGVTGCTAGQLLPSGDVTSVGTIYYTPAVGNQIPIYNGSRFVDFTFAETPLVLGSSNLANTIYDVCAFNNSGTMQVGTSVAWTTSTPGSGARGTGAATAQIARINGTWVNAVATTVKNGANTYSVPINQCTIIGSIFIDGTNGQVTFHRTYGQNRKWSAWNFYNRLPLFLKAGDATASWSTSGTFGLRAANGNSANSLTMFFGLPVDNFSVSYSSNVSYANADITAGLGLNSTSVASGLNGFNSDQPSTSDAMARITVGQYIGSATLGVNIFTALEAVTRNANTVTFSGGAANMVLQAAWQG